MTQEENDEDEDYLFCWDEADWENNKLFYENDLEWMEELCWRERHPMKEKHR